MSKDAKAWFDKNYHTPMDSFMGKHGVPVLNGIHETDTGPEEDWSNIPISDILDSYAKHYMKSRLEEWSMEKIISLNPIADGAFVFGDIDFTPDMRSAKTIGAKYLRDELLKDLEL